MAKSKKLSFLDPKKHGMAGAVLGKLKYRKQDRRFKPEEFFAVVFFPKVKGIGPARIYKHGITETLSHSKATAIAKYDDAHPSVRAKRSWKDSHAAGHMVRRIKIVDLGPA